MILLYFSAYIEVESSSDINVHGDILYTVADAEKSLLAAFSTPLFESFISVHGLPLSIIFLEKTVPNVQCFSEQ